ncbi:hypothetical protein, partial [Trichococcus sp.]|uniref:hypothetical protein n=1 Tax=Trichococcus sp. TaxID=1985464 RepID=UPI003C7EC00F
IRCIGIYALGVLHQTKVVRQDQIGHEEQGSKHKLDLVRFMATVFEYDGKQKKIQNNHSREDLYDCGK